MTKQQEKPNIAKTKKKKQKKIKMTSSTFKKNKCKHFNKGSCLKGEECTYRHDFEPDAKRKICKFFLSSACTRGQNCIYSHNSLEYPCKFLQFQAHCPFGATCKFSHDELSQEEKKEFAADLAQEIISLKKAGKLLRQQWLRFIDIKPIELQTEIINFSVNNTQDNKTFLSKKYLPESSKLYRDMRGQIKNLQKNIQKQKIKQNINQLQFFNQTYIRIKKYLNSF